MSAEPFGASFDTHERWVREAIGEAENSACERPRDETGGDAARDQGLAGVLGRGHREVGQGRAARSEHRRIEGIHPGEDTPRSR